MHGDKKQAETSIETHTEVKTKGRPVGWFPGSFSFFNGSISRNLKICLLILFFNPFH